MNQCWCLLRALFVLQACVESGLIEPVVVYLYPSLWASHKSHCPLGLKARLKANLPPTTVKKKGIIALGVAMQTFSNRPADPSKQRRALQWSERISMLEIKLSDGHQRHICREEGYDGPGLTQFTGHTVRRFVA